MNKDNCKIKTIVEKVEDLSNIKNLLLTCQPVTIQEYFFNEKGILVSEISGELGLGFNHTGTIEYKIEDNIDMDYLFNSNRKDNSTTIRSVDKKWLSNYCKTILSDNKKDLNNDDISNEYEYDNYNNWTKKTVLVNNIKRFIYEREITYYKDKKS